MRCRFASSGSGRLGAKDGLLELLSVSIHRLRRLNVGSSSKGLPANPTAGTTDVGATSISASALRIQRRRNQSWWGRQRLNIIGKLAMLEAHRLLHHVELRFLIQIASPGTQAYNTASIIPQHEKPEGPGSAAKMIPRRYPGWNLKESSPSSRLPERLKEASLSKSRKSFMALAPNRLNGLKPASQCQLAHCLGILRFRNERSRKPRILP